MQLSDNRNNTGLINVLNTEVLISETNTGTCLIVFKHCFFQYFYLLPEIKIYLLYNFLVKLVLSFTNLPNIYGFITFVKSRNKNKMELQLCNWRKSLFLIKQSKLELTICCLTLILFSSKQHSHAQRQQCKKQNNMWNLCKANNVGLLCRLLT